MKNQTDNQNPIERKRALLSALLSKEIAPNEFKERVKENGLPTRILSLKEEWQRDLEFHGSSCEVHIGGKKYTIQEILDRFEELEALLTEQKFIGCIVTLPLDPDSIFYKVDDKNRPEEERKQIFDGFCERWGLSFPTV